MLEWNFWNSAASLFTSLGCLCSNVSQTRMILFKDASIWARFNGGEGGLSGLFAGIVC